MIRASIEHESLPGNDGRDWRMMAEVDSLRRGAKHRRPRVANSGITEPGQKIAKTTPCKVEIGPRTIRKRKIQ